MYFGTNFWHISFTHNQVLWKNVITLIVWKLFVEMKKTIWLKTLHYIKTIKFNDLPKKHNAMFSHFKWAKSILIQGVDKKF